MMEKTGEGGGSSSAANSSSDFVRKLYKMLEDPTLQQIVRWGANGESFVVLENEKFTKQILPKHFKHSNFASFVRQLNKYDFHKVRHNNEDNVPSPYGPSAWEFKHPEFQANKKDSLDNIRRKAPAPRKSNLISEESIPTQQVNLLNEQLAATQQQVEILTERYQDLSNNNVMLLQHVVDLQKFVKNHERVMHSVMGFLHNVDANQRRNNRNPGFAHGINDMGVGAQENGVLDDHPSSPLQHASTLLGEFSAENLPNKELEDLCQNFQSRNDYATPSNDSSTVVPAQSEASSATIGFPADKLDLDNMVYPVGSTNGIDPVNSDHINNIPYPLPPAGTQGMIPSDAMAPEVTQQQQNEPPSMGMRKKLEPIWGERKPRILLVEDDRVCARIGSKFLQVFECGVDVARDGLEAVNKMNTGGVSSFDLILMDIIMPHLDGVSATVCIREMHHTIPIIAMTSNIRTDDIDMYFKYGMNDVLPKPFTKEGMVKALEKHLSHFKRSSEPAQFPNSALMPHPPFVAPNQGHPPLGLTIGQLSGPQSIKDDSSPGKSPQTATPFHSPSQMQGQSPIVTAAPNGFMQPMRENPPYSMTPTYSHPQSAFPPPPAPSNLGPQRPPHRRVMSDMSGAGGQDEHPEKRQRMIYPPQPGTFSQ